MLDDERLMERRLDAWGAEGGGRVGVAFVAELDRRAVAVCQAGDPPEVVEGEGGFGAVRCAEADQIAVRV